MISKKFLALSLCALGASAAVLSTGCVDGTVEAIPQTVYLNVAINDVDGAGVPNLTFDYYFDLVTFGGAQMGYYAPGKTTDSSGKWSKTESELTFLDADGNTCANECVQWENYSCIVYATDCWDTSYSDTANIYSIDNSQATSQVGVETTNGGYRVYTGTDIGSFLMDSPQSYSKNEKVDTDLAVVSSEGAASLMLAGRPNTSAGANVKYNIYRVYKPVIISDLSKLTQAQTAKLMHYREVSQLPAEAFKTSLAVSAK